MAATIRSNASWFVLRGASPVKFSLAEDSPAFDLAKISQRISVAGFARRFVRTKYRGGGDLPAGTVYLNGAQLSSSSAFMTGDVLQTRENGAANINAAGSSALVDSNSIVRFQPDGFSLDRGSISVATGKGMSVYARDFGERTPFYVTRSSGTIGIIARKNSITVTCGSQ